MRTPAEEIDRYPILWVVIVVGCCFLAWLFGRRK